MFVIQQFLLLCFASVIETNLIQNTTTRTTMTLSRSRLNSNTNRSIGKVRKEKNIRKLIIIYSIFL
jgi:hypothetical protein